MSGGLLPGQLDVSLRSHSRSALSSAALILALPTGFAEWIAQLNLVRLPSAALFSIQTATS
ncbi:MAG: hypothetical protein EXR69_05600 [Myxococcales bacterium]|nr:hypothetical protein [Myxococcales bacterium]